QQESSPNAAAVVTEKAPQATQPSDAHRLAGAANLSDVLPGSIVRKKKDKNVPNQEIEVTIASSGRLYSQITAGALYYIFLAAIQEFAAKLVDEMFKGDSSHTPFTYTQGQLSIYSATKPVDSVNQSTLTELLKRDDKTKITIANPE